jgi:Dolichyl-phosphate-mannose-protein mannosyltransferase
MSANVYPSNPVESRRVGALCPTYRAVVLALLVLVGAEIFLSNRQESQVWDESDHLYAGYEYWRHADFGRNPEHPPLAKLVAAATLLPLHPTEPDAVYGNFKSRDFYNSAEFLYSADADALLARARGMMLIFSLALALAVFAAGREMFSPEAGLLAMALFCLEPMLLANGGLITTDMTLSCLLFASVYAFYRFVKRPTAVRLLVCSIAVGLTLVAKHSGVFVYPILIAIAVADMFRTRRGDAGERSAGRTIAVLGVAFVCMAVVSYGVLWAVYGFRYAARVAGPPILPTLDAYIAAIPSGAERAGIGFCARHHLVPEAYLYGWSDILHIPGTRVSLVLGRLSTEWHWFLFPEMILMKTTISLLVLLLLVPFAGIWRRGREFLFLAIPAGFYLLIAIGSRMNAEARYVLPLYPFCLVLAGAAGCEMARRSRRWAMGVAALMVLAAASSLHAFPDYLAYANEAFGGPSQSYRLVAGANGDWAQSLKWVKSYVDTNHISDCWFDFTDPYIDPKYYGIDCKPLVSAWIPRGFPFSGEVPPTIGGTVLISATELAGRQWGPGVLNPYAQFSRLEPDAKPGNVVLVYHGTFAVPLAAAYSHSAKAERLAEEGKMAEAVAEDREAVALAPDSANIQAGLGLTLIEAGQSQEGQQVNATALRIARAVHPEFQGELIRLLEKSGMTGTPAK